MNRSQKNVQQEIKEEFLPRTDKYNEILNNKQMPSTNECCVVIPCLTKTYGFKTNQYKVHKKYLKGMISEHDFNSFVRKANSIIQKELMSKEEQQDEPFFKITSMLLKISIIFSAIALTMMAVVTYSQLQHSKVEIIEYTSVVILCLSGLVAAFCPIYLYKAQYSSLNYEIIISDKLKDLEASQNKLNETNNQKHLIWKVQNNFYWIQLHINRVMAPKIEKIDEEEINQEIFD